MALNPIKPGLRPLRYDSKSVGKVQINVQPGDELHVSDDVAGQLQRADGHFKPLDDAPPEPEPEAAEADAEPKPRRRKS